MRLNVFIAKSGYCSRRKADLLVKSGKVKVNSKKVYEPYLSIEAGSLVEVSGKVLRASKNIYLLFNKPVGVTVTLKDRFADRILRDTLPEKYAKLYPVGRLDKNSSGLLILTNDGDLCYNLTHPRFKIEKEYLLEIKGELKSGDCRRALEGVTDEGDELKVDKVKVEKFQKGLTTCRVIVHEGKKRHLRRLFKSLGFDVKNLKRIRIGGVRLSILKNKLFLEVDKKIFEPLLRQKNL